MLVHQTLTGNGGCGVNKDLIKKFQTSDGELYVGCEVVVEAIVVAAIKLTVESIAESVISRYNTHNSKLRSMSEEAVNNELWIACNGPELGGADRILSSALSKYFRHGNWHFVTRKGEQSKLYNSKVINRIISQESRLPAPSLRNRVHVKQMSTSLCYVKFLFG